jgi:tRNA uracil 4-sulfurtransferase
MESGKNSRKSDPQRSESVKFKHIIVRYNEIGLKGKNRSCFEKKLVHNILDVCGDKCTAVRHRGRIILTKGLGGKTINLENIFGISSFSPAFLVKKQETDWIEDIWQNIRSAFQKSPYKTSDNFPFNSGHHKFRISTRRVTKTTTQDSTEINTLIGSRIVDLTGWKVDLKNYDVEIGIEIIKDNAYIFYENIAGPGGLPVGVTGTVLIMPGSTENMLDCALKLLKRGCNVCFKTGSHLGEKSKKILEAYGQKYFEKDNHWAVAMPVTKYDKQYGNTKQSNNTLVLFPLV